MTNMETREPSPTDGGVATPTPGPASTNATTTTTSNATTTGKGVAADGSQSHVEAGGDDDDAKTEASTDEEEEEPEQEPHRDTTTDTSTHNQPPQDETQGGQEQSRTHEESTPQRHESRSILNSSSEDEKDTSDKSKQTASREHGEDEDDEEEEEEEEEEDDVLPPVHGEKGVEYTVNELFVNPNLRRKSANKVLKKDPFAIPRATDNVTGYRPRFNPLSILEAEEKLLPRDFKFDFSDGFHGKPQSGSSSTSAKDLSSRESATKDTVEGSSYFVRKVPPVRNPQTFGDKLATMGLLMGSMPRQAQASPLINTPTVHNPFGEPLLELVATSEPPSSEPITLQPLRGMGPPTPLPIVPEALVPELGLDVDMNGISGLSKLSLVANAAADASLYPAYAAAFGRVAPTTPTSAYDGLMSYLPGHFAEKRLPPQLAMVSSTAQYDVAAFHAANERSIDGVQDEYMDSIDDAYPTDFAPPPAVSRDHAHMNEYDPESTTSSPTSTQQSLQPVAKKPRSKNVFRPCSAPGCTKGARGKSGLCQKHGGGKRCATPNCPKGAQGSSKYCLFHGGGYRCTVPGCTTGARGTSGLCAKHGGYKRARGETDDGETAVSHGGDGQATKNPRLDYEGRAIADSEG